MLGKTHIAVGIASSLTILRPTTINGVVCAIIGGSVGGWISDIDCRKKTIDGDAVANLIFTTCAASSLLFVDYLFGNGICSYMKANWNIRSLIALLVFATCCIFGFMTAHRTFMHSFSAMLITAVSLSIACKPVAMPYLIGFASHLLLDISNKRGLRLLFPLNKKFYLNKFSSAGKANYIIIQVSTVISIIMSIILVMRSFAHQQTSQEFINGLLNSNKFFGLNSFQVYMIIINLIAFFAFFIDYLVCTFTNWEDNEEWGQSFIHTILNYLGYFGGPFGILLSFVVLRQRIGKHNANWHAIIGSLAIIWGVIYCIICDPLKVGLSHFQSGILYHIPLCVYLVLINGISFTLFFIDRNTSRSKWDVFETVLFLTGFLGGALGGLIAMSVTGKKKGSAHFSDGFVFMFTAHMCFISYLLYAGIA